MSSVHISISKQVKKKVKAIETYKQMDNKREKIIDKLVLDYQSGKVLDLSQLNNWSKEMNQFAISNLLPTRKIVTLEMFQSYVKTMERKAK